MLKALTYPAGQLRHSLWDLQYDRFTGAVYIDAVVNAEQKPRTRVLVMRNGEIIYGGLKIPDTNQEFAKIIGILLNHSVADFAIKYAAKKLQNPISFRELLEQIVQIRVFQWEKIEAVVYGQVVQALEQTLPHPGELRLDVSVQLDLSYGQDGHGLDWTKLLQEVTARHQEWAALAPVIPSMDAVPRLTLNAVQNIKDNKVQQHLWQWVDGTRSLVDIAEKLGENPLQLAQSYRVWAVSGWITFKADEAASPDIAATAKQRPLILSVDDSTIVQTMIKRTLSDRYEVLLVSNAVDALKVINTNPIKLLLLDVTMPEIDGLEFCQTVRSIPKFKNLPIIMLTARDKFSDKLRGKIVGATHYLTKPVEPDRLLEIVNQCIEQKPSSFIRESSRL